MWARIKQHLVTKRFDGKQFEAEVQGHADAWGALRGGGGDTAASTPKTQGPLDTRVNGHGSTLQGLQLHPASRFVVILSPTVHEWFFPYFTPEAISRFNEMARSIYSKAGWDVIDAEAMTR
jgi:hypothetical protein